MSVCLERSPKSKKKKHQKVVFRPLLCKIILFLQVIYKFLILLRFGPGAAACVANTRRKQEKLEEEYIIYIYIYRYFYMPTMCLRGNINRRHGG